MADFAEGMTDIFGSDKLADSDKGALPSVQAFHFSSSLEGCTTIGEIGCLYSCDAARRGKSGTW